ncbi:MAG: endonuclease/exonuclease/phosphatase family protein [Paracoccaceae bacterium]
MKIMTWNAEWLDHAWGVVAGKYAPGEKLYAGKAPTAEAAAAKIAAITALVGRIDPDILFLCEGPETAAEAAAFTAAALPGFGLVERPAGDGYGVSGTQGLWFLVRSSLSAQLRPTLVPLQTFRAFVNGEVAVMDAKGKWMVALPRLQDFGEIKDVPVSTRAPHGFARSPQILRFSWGGAVHEVIGLHLKSKFVKKRPKAREPGQSFEDYAARADVRRFLAEAHAARVKLTSEIAIVRQYVDHRFSLDADPSIFVLGDLNDGPGKELMEREYLLHDLISNLQGDVFFARKFLNHALFDQPQDLRWTTRFVDFLDPGRDPDILLDHILFTQALTRSGTSPLRVPALGGRVEHLAYEETLSLHGEDSLSDHRPVTVLAEARSA